MVARPDRKRTHGHFDKEPLALNGDLRRQVAQRCRQQRRSLPDARERAPQRNGGQVDFRVVEYLREEAHEANALFRIKKLGHWQE